jgi:pimeloyl-ACP methyl ester carboxylesterase
VELTDDPVVHAEPPATWSGVLALLARIARDARLLLILDEVPYWVARDPSVPSTLQNWWDAEGRHLNLMVLLCGSAVQMMEQLFSGEAPRAGCVTGRLPVGPFDFRAAAQLLSFPSPTDTLAAYGILGGVPLYLSLFDHSLSIEQWKAVELASLKYGKQRGEAMATDAAEAAHGQYVTANGMRIYFEERGSGQPLLLLHGGFTTHADWNSQLAAWTPHFRVITPDSRGHGRTENPAGAISYELMAQDVIALVEALGLRKPMICGYSDGACVALQIAVSAPELAAAYILMDAWLWNAKRESQRGLQIMQDRLGISGPVREQLDDTDLESVEQHSADTVAFLRAAHQPGSGLGNWMTYLKNMWPAWSRLTEHGAAELQRIITPTLVVVGDRDEFQPLSEAVELYRHLPNAELAVIPGMDHGAPMSNRADLLSQVVLHFLLRQPELAPAA